MTTTVHWIVVYADGEHRVFVDYGTNEQLARDDCAGKGNRELGTAVELRRREITETIIAKRG